MLTRKRKSATSAASCCSRRAGIEAVWRRESRWPPTRPALVWLLVGADEGGAEGGVEGGREGVEKQKERGKAGVEGGSEEERA